MNDDVKQSMIESAWHDLGSYKISAMPEDKLDWLVDVGSLTRKLIGACSPGQFRVNLLSQNWARPLPSESKVLNMRRGESALIREVQLFCNQTPWVFARTVIPVSSFSGKARRLAYLRNKPLGALLFSDPTTIRENMQISKLLPGNFLWVKASEGLLKQPEELWGRRTLFYYAHKPLLVNEIFLPDIK